MTQGCVLSPLLYSLSTHDCVPVYGSNTIIKFADDTTAVGLIRGDNKTASREWCANNNMALNTQKTSGGLGAMHTLPSTSTEL